MPGVIFSMLEFASKVCYEKLHLCFQNKLHLCMFFYIIIRSCESTILIMENNYDFFLFSQTQLKIKKYIQIFYAPPPLSNSLLGEFKEHCTDGNFYSIQPNVICSVRVFSFGVFLLLFSLSKFVSKTGHFRVRLLYYAVVKTIVTFLILKITVFFFFSTNLNVHPNIKTPTKQITQFSISNTKHKNAESLL